MENPKFKFTIKPSKLNVFVASNLALIVRPLRTLIAAIFCSFVLTVLTLGISTPSVDSFTLIILIVLVFGFFFTTGLLFFELIIILTIMTKKMLTAEVEVEFMENEMVSKRTGIETRIKYSSLQFVKRIGIYVLFKVKGFNSTCYCFFKTESEAKEVTQFLNNKINI